LRWNSAQLWTEHCGYAFVRLGIELHNTQFGIRLTPMLTVLSIFTVSLAIGAYVRRGRIPEGDRFVVAFGFANNDLYKVEDYKYK
jgi:uncharacterized membrane protein